MLLIISGILFFFLVGFIMYFKGHLGGFPALYKKYMDGDYTCDEFDEYVMNHRNNLPVKVRDPVAAKLFKKYPDYVKDENLTYKLTVFFQDNDFEKRIKNNEFQCKMGKKYISIAEKCDSVKYKQEINEFENSLARKDC